MQYQQHNVLLDWVFPVCNSRDGLKINVFNFAESVVQYFGHGSRPGDSNFRLWTIPFWIQF